ncbi:methyl-accepting chemotaxis sensory transducer [Dickeya parazeae Ech586]|uniref:Methyl-accepting chemotaxis sensory transducer n=1 Tax=Dickeya zeae (strain Ech586) TaxID=590409 RepID=D2BWH8_DICZ5|nr:methyl-accepting chemotaxis protein [Dickeya parazeae]ACZ78331.1 methyl-accepting chemotaxis sensory transducer [Dickeya parazeae Ech586]
MKNTMTVKRQIVVGFIIPILVSVVLGISGLITIRHISNILTEVNDENSVKQFYAVNLRGSVHDRSIAVRDLLIADKQELSVIINNINKLAEIYQQSDVKLDAMLNQLAISGHEKTLYQNIQNSNNKTSAIIARLIALQNAGNSDAARTLLLSEGRGAFVQWLADVNAFINYEAEQNNQLTHIARETARYFSVAMPIVLIVALLLGTLAMFATRRRIFQALGAEPAVLLTMTRAIASGNLTEKTLINDRQQHSVMAAIETMRQSLINIVANVSTHAEGVTIASENISKSSVALSQRTDMQVSALQQTSAAMGQVSESVKDNAASARQASQLSENAASETHQGNQLVSKIVDTMENIKRHSDSISSITKVIEDIAFQTNILAINAAVEAARAGEVGRGFSVVAAEIRTLSQKTTASAHQIKHLIDASSEKIGEGYSEISQASEVMQKINQAVDLSSEFIRKIADTSAEQSIATQEIARSLAEMERTTQQNAAMVEQTTTDTAYLETHSQELKQSVSRFTIADSMTASAMTVDSMMISKTPRLALSVASR